jgi:small basic protein
MRLFSLRSNNIVFNQIGIQPRAIFHKKAENNIFVKTFVFNVIV